MYSILLIDGRGRESYLSVRGRTEWKTKITAARHAQDIRNCKNMPWDTVAVDVVSEFGEVV